MKFRIKSSNTINSNPECNLDPDNFDVNHLAILNSLPHVMIKNQVPGDSLGAKITRIRLACV